VSVTPWWARITPEELAALRHRVVRATATRFAAVAEPEVEDAVHHAFVALFRNRASISAENDGLYRYMVVAARRAALDRIKTETLRAGRRHEAARVTEFGPSALAEVLLRENKQAIRTFLGELDQLDRFILWSHVVDGRSIHAIAQELGIGWHRASATVERLLGELRRLLVA
jgi:RNA polymerase sigma factor (sigma-70 family)